MFNVFTKMSNRKTKGKGTFQRSVKCVAVWVVWLKKEKKNSSQVVLWENFGGMEHSDLRLNALSAALSIHSPNVDHCFFLFFLLSSQLSSVSSLLVKIKTKITTLFFISILSER